MNRGTRRIQLTLLVLLLWAGSADASERLERAAERIDQFVDRFASEGKVSGQFLVDLGDGLTYQRNVGLANDAYGIKIDSATRFLIASISKNYTAAAILRLQELGKLAVKDPIANYFPEIAEDRLTDGEPVRIHHLLNHTSGLVDAYDAPAISSREYLEPFGMDLFLKVLADSTLVEAPGTNMRYSNTGYVLLGEIVRRVSGQTFADFVGKELFARAELTETTVGFPLGHEPVVAASSERLEDRRVSFFAHHKIRMLHTGEVFADGNLYSTARDVARWVRALTAGKILSRRSLQSMFEPSSTEYGYGWRIPEWGQASQIIWHGGYYTGYASVVMHSLKSGTTVIALTNQPEEELRDEAFAVFHAICSDGG